MTARAARCVSNGYALIAPSGSLSPLSFRGTEVEAITSLFALEDWTARQSEGWTVEFVYARIFTPKFFVDVIPEAVPAGEQAVA